MYIKILIAACFIGCIMAFFFYRDINRDVQAITQKNDIVYLFQVGVFKSVDNANNFVNNFNSAVIYPDGEYYRVIIGIVHSKDAKNMLEGFFSNLSINYYIKEIRVSKDFIDNLESYETILIKSSNKDVIFNINLNMLNSFITYLN